MSCGIPRCRSGSFFDFESGIDVSADLSALIAFTGSASASPVGCRRRYGWLCATHLADIEAELLKPVDQPLRSAFRVQAVEVIVARFVKACAVADDMKQDDQNAMRDLNGGFLHAHSLGEPKEQRRQKCAFGMARRPCRLHQSAPQIAIPLPSPALLTFAPAFVVTGAQRGPAGQMFAVGKSAQVGTDFRQHRSGGDSVDARHLAHPPDQICVRNHVQIEAPGDLGHLLIETVEIVEQAAEQIAKVFAVTPRQSFSQLRLLCLKAANAPVQPAFRLFSPRPVRAVSAFR